MITKVVAGFTQTSALARSAVVVAAGVALGILTAYAQEWLPAELGSLANSAGSWALVAFTLAVLLAIGVRDAALIGSLALLALLAGYVLASDVRGYSAGQALVLFWGAAALVAGPIVGIAGYWVRREDDMHAALGVGAMSGILIGEGVYGLTFIVDTTYAPYWWGEALVGILLVVWVASRRHLGLQAAATATAVGAATAGVFVVLYSQDLIAVLH